MIRNPITVHFNLQVSWRPPPCIFDGDPVLRGEEEAQPEHGNIRACPEEQPAQEERQIQPAAGQEEENDWSENNEE